MLAFCRVVTAGYMVRLSVGLNWVWFFALAICAVRTVVFPLVHKSRYWQSSKTLIGILRASQHGQQAVVIALGHELDCLIVEPGVRNLPDHAVILPVWCLQSEAGLVRVYRIYLDLLLCFQDNSTLLGEEVLDLKVSPAIMGKTDHPLCHWPCHEVLRVERRPNKNGVKFLS